MYNVFICMHVLTCPAVGNLTTFCNRVASPSVVAIILFTTLVATFLSAVVGGDVSGRERICPSVNFDGEKVCISCMQPEVVCFLRFFGATTSVQSGFSHFTSKSPSMFITIFVASGNDVSVTSWTTLQ